MDNEKTINKPAPNILPTVDENKYRTFFEVTADALIVSDLNGTPIDCNPAALELFGYKSLDELKGLTTESFYVDKKEREELLRILKEKGSIRNYEVKLMNKSGSPIYALISSAIAKYGKNKILALTSLHDITDRKLIENVRSFLIASGRTASGEEFFQALARYLAETLRMDYVCIDRLLQDNLAAQTVSVYFDGKFEDNVAYTLKDTPCGDVVDKIVCCFPRHVRKLFPNDEVLQEMSAECYIGTTLRSSVGEAIGLIAIIGRKPLENPKLAETILEIVALRASAELERKIAEEELARYAEELKKMNATKDKLFSIISHDLRSPFHPLLNISRLLFEGCDLLPKEKIKSYAKSIYDSAGRIHLLLQNLLEWSAAQTGVIAYNPADLFLREKSEEVINTLSENAAQKKISLQNLIVSALQCHADEQMLRSVIHNLISNALKFTSTGGTITLDAKYENDSVVVSVNDSGVGISPEQIGRLFTLENMQSTVGTNQEKGSGLGLLLCRDFVELHGGSIWVESTLGKGSTFFFSLPAASDQHDQ